MNRTRSFDVQPVGGLEPTRPYTTRAVADGSSAPTIELTNFAPSISAEIESLLRSRLGAVSICAVVERAPQIGCLNLSTTTQTKKTITLTP